MASTQFHLPLVLMEPKLLSKLLGIVYRSRPASH
jgi:hypothetical protein